MALPVLFREAALRDLDDQIAWLSARSAGAAERFAVAMESVAGRLRSHPRIGHPVHVRAPSLRGLRTWPVPGFPEILIVYLVDADAVRVLRVLHGARDLPGIMEDGSP